MNVKIIICIAGSIFLGIIVVMLVIFNVPQINTIPELTNVPYDNNNILFDKNKKLGLVITSPTSSITLKELDKIYQKAATTGIGRNNVYMFWNIIEPERDQYDWKQYDTLMGLNQKNNLTVTLYFSLINGKTLGPFPDWIGNPKLDSISEDNLVNVLDSILSRYYIIDSIIIAGGIDEYFRYKELDISVYKDLFNGVYNRIKEKHPDVKIGNSFELHNTLNKNLVHIVKQISFGDFVAITYLPTDTLNEINKTPTEAIKDLEKLKEIVSDKKIAIFEISWSTSKIVKGSIEDQTIFINKLYDFYDIHKQDIEFITWYRMYDRPEGTCEVDESTFDDPITLGNSTFVIQRLGNYICSAGLLAIDDKTKSGWNEFSNQINDLR